MHYDFYKNIKQHNFLNDNNKKYLFISKSAH